MPDELDVSMLAHISNGFSAAAIVTAVEKTLTARRIERLDRRLLTEDEFVGTLSRQPRMDAYDHKKFKEFVHNICT